MKLPAHLRKFSAAVAVSVLFAVLSTAQPANAQTTVVGGGTGPSDVRITTTIAGDKKNSGTVLVNKWSCRVDVGGPS